MQHTSTSAGSPAPRPTPDTVASRAAEPARAPSPFARLMAVLHGDKYMLGAYPPEWQGGRSHSTAAPAHTPGADNTGAAAHSPGPNTSPASGRAADARRARAIAAAQKAL